MRSNHKSHTYLSDFMRCFSCLWIIFFHSHMMSAYVSAAEPCMTYIREFPILGFFATSTLAVDIFWIMSGFLCEYQINTKVLTEIHSEDNKNISDLHLLSKLFWFFINRLLRIYPFYMIAIATVIMETAFQIVLQFHNYYNHCFL